MQKKLIQSRDSIPSPPAEPADGDESAMSSTAFGKDDHSWELLGATHVLAGIQPAAFTQLSGDDTAVVDPVKKAKETSILGDYQLLKKLGEGAMGAVYKARQLSIDREVALKVLFPHIASNPKLVQRLNREGRVMGQLDHPNMVQGYGIGEDRNWHYVAMEYVDGESLQRWLARLGRLNVGDALHVTLACASALGHAHSQNLIHRDIKPDNILISRTGAVKVADFGMVKTSDEDLSLTQTGHAVGTPWYMPLEQARNAKETDGRCDIYALGCMLYCLLTGKPPFIGQTIVEVIHAKEVGTFATARSSNPDVPERLDLIITKMTAKLPKYRYQTCEEVIKDLENLHLASPALSFLNTPGSSSVDTKVDVLKTRSGTAVLPKKEADGWYVRVKHGDGRATVHKFDHAQIKKMLEDGSLKPSFSASRQKGEGYRALSTYREFEGAALSRASKEAADRQAARFRTAMKKIGDSDIAPDSKREKKPVESRIAVDWSSMLLPALVVGGFMLFFFFMWYVVTKLF